MHQFFTFLFFCCLGISVAHGDYWLPSGPSISTHYASGALIRNNAQFLVYGGKVNVSGPITNLVQVYDFDSNYWETQNFTNLPARYAHCSAYDDNHGIMYVFGGTDSNGNRSNQLWSFDIETGHVLMYSNNNPSPVNRTECALSYWNGMIYLYGGRNNTNLLGDLWTYNLTSLDWTLRDNNIPYGSGFNRSGASSFTTQTGLWLIFGGCTSLSATTYTNEMLIFDLQQDNWWDVIYMPRAAADSAMTVTPDGTLLTFGGIAGGVNVYYDTMLQFHIYSWQYMEGGSSIGRFGHVMGVSGNRVIIFGGNVDHADLYIVTDVISTTVASYSETTTFTTPSSSWEDPCPVPPPMISNDGSINLPSQPDVHFSLNNNAQNYLNIEVDFDFVQNNSMYIWDFVPNDYTNNQVYSEWMPRSNVSNHFRNMNRFNSSNWWRSPSSACNLDAYTYQYDRWNVYHQGSNRMSSSASFDVFTLIQGGAWSIDSEGNVHEGTALATVETTDSEIVIRGTFYIYLLRARDVYSYPATIDNMATWKYPFEIRYEKFLTGRTDLVVSTENGTETALPVTNLRKLDVLSSGKLIVSFDTELQSTSAVYAGNPKVMSSPVPMMSNTTVPTSACVSPCTQRWTFTSSNVSQSYSGGYIFAFQVLPATGKREIVIGSYFTVQMNLELEIRGTVSLNGSLSSSLQLFQDNIYSSERNYFNTGDVVVAVHSAPYAGMRLTPQNAWLCVQDGNGYLSSCLYSNSSVQLICDGSICPGAEQFNATIQYNPFYGVIRFVAQPLVGNTSALYVFEVSSALQSQKRQLSAKTYVRSALLRITKQQQPSATIPEEYDNVESSCTATTPSFLVVALFIAVLHFRS